MPRNLPYPEQFLVASLQTTFTDFSFVKCALALNILDFKFFLKNKKKSHTFFFICKHKYNLMKQFTIKFLIKVY